MLTVVETLIPDVLTFLHAVPWWFPYMLEVQNSAMCRYFKYIVWVYSSTCSCFKVFLAYCYIIRTIGYSKLNPITLLVDNLYCIQCIQYCKNTLIMVRKSISTLSITWFVSKILTNTSLLVFWPNYCMGISFGSIYLLNYLLSMTISTFVDPQMFAIASTACIFVQKKLHICERILSLLFYNNVNVFASYDYFWEYLHL